MSREIRIDDKIQSYNIDENTTTFTYSNGKVIIPNQSIVESAYEIIQLGYDKNFKADFINNWMRENNHMLNEDLLLHNFVPTPVREEYKRIKNNRGENQN